MILRVNTLSVFTHEVLATRARARYRSSRRYRPLLSVAWFARSTASRGAQRRLRNGTPRSAAADPLDVEARPIAQGDRHAAQTRGGRARIRPGLAHRDR